ncbi:MAG TPA: anti-sigma factor [Vicinamibacterales bacterium]|nr:anti-sigma factor [Vicinamibacterales bacterium]
MNQDDPGLEQRLSRFEAQLDRFSLALHQWQARDQAQRAILPDVDRRIRSIEETLDRESQALRQLHEEPLKRLQAQAASLQELCVTASASVSGLGEAEARLVELQANVSLLLNELSRTLQTLITELQVRGVTAISAQSQPTSWPLERVVHLHDELRRIGNGAAVPVLAPGRRVQGARTFHTVAEEPEPTRRTDDWLALLRRKDVAGGMIVVAALLLIFGVVRWIEGRLNDASSRLASAEQQVTITTQLANQEVASARQNADRQIAEARGVAQRAETVGAILTAPDLIKFNLTSTGVDGSSAQLLWSRTRGLVLSGSRLPAAPPESTYQLWLVTNTQSVGAGLFVPDASGRATLVVDPPPAIAGNVVGAAVTIEPPGGRAAPSGKTLLTRYP